MKRRRITLDLAGADPPSPKNAMLSHEQIGPKRHLTHEGFLLCEDVPIARTGWMIYGPGETPVKTGDGGYSMVHRDAETLFHQQCIASFNGKSITNDHPPEGVNPENWSKVTVGSTHNVHRGAGDDHDVLLADLLVTDRKAIKDVQAGKVEVSAGYDADYETTGPGEGRQLNIIGNHIALVERGRCGPRCAIGDKSTTLKGRHMPQASTGVTRRKIGLSAAQRQAVLDKGMEAMESAMADPVLMGGNVDPDDPETESVGGEESHIHIHLNGAPGGGSVASGPDKTVVNEDGSIGTGAVMKGENEELEGSENPPLTSKGEGGSEDPVEQRFKKIEDSLEQIMQHIKPKTGDEESEEGVPGAKGGDPEDDDEQTGKTGDSKALETAYRTLVADAEILVPGFKPRTFDSKAPRKITVDAMCALRRTALVSVGATSDGMALLEVLNGGKTVDAMSFDCKAVAALFKTAATTKRLANNRVTTGDGKLALPNAKPAYKAPTIADIQAANSKAFPRPESH